MHSVQLLLAGFHSALTLYNVILLLLGVIGGILFALLPGLNLVMIVILLLPLTYGMATLNAISLLLGAYVGGTYGGVITAILYNVPGDSIHVPMLWDGYAMNRSGKAALAIGWTLVAFIIGGFVAAVVSSFVSGPIASLALKLSTPEFFSIIIFGLTTVSALGASLGASGPATILSLVIGIFLGTVGVEDIYGATRFNFGVHFLGGGIHFLPVMIGIYAIGEVLGRLRTKEEQHPEQRASGRWFALPGVAEIGRKWATFFRGTLVGTLIGALPGAGATVASFVSYGMEKNFGKQRDKLGTGIPEGLASSQTAATASVGGALIPLLTLGIPGSAADAVILGALQLHNVDPSPMVFASQPQLIYPIFAGVFIAVALTVLVTLASMRGLVSVLRLPPGVLATFILVFSLIGAYTVRSNFGDVWIAVLSGFLGYALNRLKFPTAPLLLGVILGPLAESNFMTSMISFQDNWTIFFTRPVSASFLFLSLVAIAVPVIQKARARRSPGGQTQLYDDA